MTRFAPGTRYFSLLGFLLQVEPPHSDTFTDIGNKTHEKLKKPLFTDKLEPECTCTATLLTVSFAHSTHHTLTMHCPALGWGRVWTGQVESSWVESGKVKSGRVGSSRVGSGLVRSIRGGLSQVGSSRVRSGRVESSRLGRVKLGLVGSGRVGSSRVELGWVEQHPVKQVWDQWFRPGVTVYLGMKRLHRCWRIFWT